MGRFWFAMMALIVALDGCATAQPTAMTKKWSDRVIPLPREMVVSGEMEVAVGRIRLEPSGLAASPVKTAETLLGVFALAKSGEKADVSLELRLVGTDTPADLKTRLEALPNPGQAYAIRSSQTGETTRISVYANTPDGLLYGTQTLRLLLKDIPKADSSKLAVPLVDIIDWPAMEFRGQWSYDILPFLPWYSEWKLNEVDVYAGLGFDGNGTPIVRLNTAAIDTAAALGIRAIPFIPHVSDLRGEAGIEQARHVPALAKYLPVLGKPLDGKSGLCCSEPMTAELFAQWMELCAASIQGRHNELELWMTEGFDHCQDDFEKSGGKPKLIELDMILKAFATVKARHPDLRLRLWLSQGTYGDSNHPNMHDDIIKRLPKDVGLVFYNSGLTYVSDHKMMIPENLGAFSRAGGFLGVVPQLTNSWFTVLPWTAPQFVHFRMKEFTDKKLNAVTSFTVPNAVYHEFNIMAMAEWGWNPDGRSPRDFCVAYATVMGKKEPERWANWAMKAGSSGWELAESLFFMLLAFDPAIGLHGDQPVDHRFNYEKNYQANLDAATADGEEACRLAVDYGDIDMIDESRFTLAGLRGLGLVQRISAKIKKGTISESEKRQLAKDMDELDVCAETAASHVHAWGERKFTRNQEINLKAKSDPAVTQERLADTLDAFLQTCEIVHDLAAPLGVVDGRPELRQMDLGEWRTADIKNGQLALEYNITDLLKDRPERWSRVSLRLRNLNGYGVYIAGVKLYAVDIKTGARTLKFDSFACGKKQTAWQTSEIMPVFQPGSEKKLILSLSLSVNCPVAYEYPANRVRNPLECAGSVQLRRLCNYEALASLEPSPVSTPGSDGTAFPVRARTAGEPVQVGVYMGYGAPGIVAGLNQRPGINAFAISKLDAENLGKCDVAVIPQQTNIASFTKYLGAVSAWAGNGGGVMLLHDAVGFRMHMPVFRSIGKGVDNLKSAMVKVTLQHALTKGMAVGETFSPGFTYDHIAIERGPQGVVVAEDANGTPTVVAGEFGKGRIVLNGMLCGVKGNDRMGAEASVEEKELDMISNAVRWLARPINMVGDSGAENPLPKSSGALAAGWTQYYGSGKGRVELVPEAAHSGKLGAMAKIEGFQSIDDKTGRYNSFNQGIAVGGAVEPDTTYRFGFWFKGDAPSAAINILTWEADGKVQCSRPLNMKLNGAAAKDSRNALGVLTPSDKWTHYSGEFRTGKGTSRATVNIVLCGTDQGLKVGQYIYVDDAEIVCID